MKTTSRFFAVIFYCAIAIFFAYGCSGNDALFDLEEASRVSKPQYLDVDPPVNGGFSKEQFEILSLAYQRLADYLVIEKDGYLHNSKPFRSHNSYKCKEGSKWECGIICWNNNGLF